MRAAICIKHGDPKGIEIKEVKKPSIKKDEILIKIDTTTVTSGDVALRKQSFLQFLIFWPLARLFFGIKNQRKKILGHEFSGTIESVGKNVIQYKTGDAVFGTTGLNGGAHAEFLKCSEDNILVKKPDNLRFEEAAAIPIGGICALHFLKKAGLSEGEKIIIYGASGSIGTYAVQLAGYFKAHVTGVCSTSNIDLVKQLGADIMLDYMQDDFAKTDNEYDVIFDTVGKFPKSKANRLLTENGRYVSTHSSPVKEKQEHLELLSELAFKGIIKPVIDRTYSLEDIREAHTYVETGKKKGNVVIKINRLNSGK